MPEKIIVYRSIAEQRQFVNRIRHPHRLRRVMGNAEKCHIHL